MDIDLEELAAMVELLKEAEFSEFRYEKADLRIVIRRGGVSADDREPVAPSANANADSSGSRALPASHTNPSIPARAAAGAGSAVNPIDREEGAEWVTAPLLGTFYQRPKPGEAPFVSIGDIVEADTVMCIVEVMKLMNSVLAGKRGIVSAIHANDGDLVEFGQPLFSLTPAAD